MEPIDGIVVIDAGHGGSGRSGRSSAIGVRGPGGTLEKDVMLALAHRVASHYGPRALLTRSGDVNLTLAERSAIAQRLGAAAFVSLHANAGPPGSGGAEAYVHERAGHVSAQLAASIQGELSRYGSAAPVQRAALGVLAPERHAPHTAACLLEVDYLSDAHGEQRLRDPHQLDAMAGAIARGIQRFTGYGQQAGLRITVPDSNPNVALSASNNWREEHGSFVDGGAGTVGISGDLTLEGTGPDEVQVEIAALEGNDPNAARTIYQVQYVTVRRDTPMLFSFNAAGVRSGIMSVRLRLDPPAPSGSTFTIRGRCTATVARTGGFGQQPGLRVTGAAPAALEMTASNRWVDSRGVTVAGAGTLSVSGSLTLAGATRDENVYVVATQEDDGPILHEQEILVRRDQPTPYSFQVAGVTAGNVQLYFGVVTDRSNPNLIARGTIEVAPGR